AIDNGTSMASPVVAGLAAIYLGRRPDASPAALATALTNGAASGHVIDPGSGSPNLLAQVVTPGIVVLAAPGVDDLLRDIAAHSSAIDLAPVDRHAGTFTVRGCTSPLPEMDPDQYARVVAGLSYVDVDGNTVPALSAACRPDVVSAGAMPSGAALQTI